MFKFIKYILLCIQTTTLVLLASVIVKIKTKIVVLNNTMLSYNLVEYLFDIITS